MNYDAFLTTAFASGINPEPLRQCRAWVEHEIRFHLHLLRIRPECDLGFAELADIHTVEQGMARLKYLDQCWQLEGKRAYREWCRRPDREGKGIYRIALKTFYLMHT